MPDRRWTRHRRSSGFRMRFRGSGVSAWPTSSERGADNWSVRDGAAGWNRPESAVTEAKPETMRVAQRSIRWTRIASPADAAGRSDAAGARLREEKSMTNIVAGRFELQVDAEAATNELFREGFARDQVSRFFVNMPGQHGRFAVGGDRNVSPGAHGAATGAVIGAVVGGFIGLFVGFLAAPWFGTVGTIAAAAAGVYLGSLGGALFKLQDKELEPVADTDAEPEVRQAGVMLAAHAPSPERRAVALEILLASGAKDIEAVDGLWRDGRWADFDPVKPLGGEHEHVTEEM